MQGGFRNLPNPSLRKRGIIKDTKEGESKEGSSGTYKFCTTA